MLRVLAVCALVVIPGCLGEDAPFSSESGVTSLAWALEDFPAGAEYLLVEVTPQASARIETVAVGDWRLGGDADPCMLHQLGAEGSALVGPEAALVAGARPAGDALVRQSSPLGASLAWRDVRLAMSAGEPVHALVALDSPSLWRGRATFAWSITSDVPFTWRLVETGEMDCVTRLRQFEEGRLVETPGFVVAKGLRHTYGADRAVYGWASARADEGGSFRVESPSAVLVEGTQARGLDVSSSIVSLEPGPHRVHLDGRGRGVAASVLLVDLPRDVVLAFRP